MSTIKSKENLSYEVNADDLIPLVNYVGDTPQSVTPAQLAKKIVGDKVLTVGAGGMFATVAEAVSFINTTTRYNTVYSTGTCGMTNGSKSITPEGGADWSALSTAANGKQVYLRIVASETIYIPIQGITPNVNNDPTWGNYGELKYKYEGATGNKTYSLVEPVWYHIQLLAGTVVDPVAITWPLFTSISGVSKEASVWQGSIGVNIATPGFFARDFTWGTINLVWNNGEESLITSNGSLTAEGGYAEILLQNIGGGQGNCDRDVLYRKTDIETYALFYAVNCDFYGHYDVIQCIARNVVFRANDVFVNTQDTVIMFATGFRWFSSATPAPGAVVQMDISNNNFHIIATGGARAALGIILADDFAGYLTNPPDFYGRIVNNHIQVHQLGTGNATGISMTPFLMAANDSRVFIDGNTFDVVASGGTKNDIVTHASASQLLLGSSNVRIDGVGELDISGAPKRLENHGTSAAIATGATIAHGLGATPSYVNVIPNSNKTDVYVTVDATNITVNYVGGGTSTFSWEAKL